jgi:hypothetical protein
MRQRPGCLICTDYYRNRNRIHERSCRMLGYSSPSLINESHHSIDASQARVNNSEGNLGQLNGRTYRQLASLSLCLSASRQRASHSLTHPVMEGGAKGGDVCGWVGVRAGLVCCLPPLLVLELVAHARQHGITQSSPTRELPTYIPT